MSLPRLDVTTRAIEAGSAVENAIHSATAAGISEYLYILSITEWITTYEITTIVDVFVRVGVALNRARVQ